MNNHLRDERSKAIRLLSMSTTTPTSPSFNLSDLKTDKTQYLGSPKHPDNAHKSDFEPSEFLARSTALKENQKNIKKIEKFDMMMMDIDDIMRTSVCKEVKDRFRESLANRPSSSSRPFEDKHPRTTMTTDMNSSGASSFWAKPNGQNASMSNESFKPAEELVEKLYQDEIEHEQQFAVIPRVDPAKAPGNSNWTEMSQHEPPEMSFGVYAKQYQKDNIRDIYSGMSPPKKSRNSKVDTTNDEMSLGEDGTIDGSHIRRMILAIQTPKEKTDVFKFSNDINEVHKIINENALESDSPSIQSCSQMMNSLNFDHVVDLAEKEVSRHRSKGKYDDDLIDIYPSKESDYFHDENSVPNMNRGQKRRTSSAYETPRTALLKCVRSKSPDVQQREKKSQKLKPVMSQSVFKIPNSVNESSSHFRSREFSSAHASEKLSLPNFNLARATTSPGSSTRISHESGQLKRTSSQLSTGSEFHDDVLPLKFPKSQRKISFPSLKVHTTMVISLIVQNGSDKRLPLIVKVHGGGFSVAIQENIRMLAQEVRSIEIRFQPSQVGAYRGDLVFELATNGNVFKKIPLFGYGGHTSLKIDGLQKAPVGPNFVTLGLVKNINSAMEKKISFTNLGSLPGFGVVVFEKSKIAELCSNESVQVEPEEFRLCPGETQQVTIRFKPRKDEIRKIVNLNKEVSVVGELYVLCSDEPTRLRLLLKKEQIPLKLSDFLPPYFENEEEIQQQLSWKNFHENFDEKTLTGIIQRIYTQHIALTLDRNLDETQLIAAQVSLSDESMSFCDDEATILSTDFEEKFDEDFYLESRHFRIHPASLVFDRKENCLQKHIKVHSLSNSVHYVKAVSSCPKLVSATKQCGQMKPGEIYEINVAVKPKAFDCVQPAQIIILVGEARIEIPVKFV